MFRYSNILKKVEVPLLKNPECQELLRDTRLGPFFELDSSFLCAGGEKNIDTCKGDGGSPLTCEQADGSWVQAGIVSWGIGCGIADVPAVYSSVSTVACWIDSKVRALFVCCQFVTFLLGQLLLRQSRNLFRLHSRTVWQKRL